MVITGIIKNAYRKICVYSIDFRLWQYECNTSDISEATKMSGYPRFWFLKMGQHKIVSANMLYTDYHDYEMSALADDDFRKGTWKY